MHYYELTVVLVLQWGWATEKQEAKLSLGSPTVLPKIVGVT